MSENLEKYSYEIEQPYKNGTVKGTCTVENRKYNYDYPFNRTVSQFLKNGDLGIIANKTGYHVSYVSYVLAGEKFNGYILEVAEQLALLNQEHDLKVAKLNSLETEPNTTINYTDSTL